MPKIQSRAQRLATVRRNLMEHPESDRAWRWKIQAKILKYLLSTYGDIHDPGHGDQGNSDQGHSDHVAPEPPARVQSLPDFESVPVVTCDDAVLANTLAAKLEHAGIRVNVVSRATPNVRDRSPHLELLVAASDIERALAMLADRDDLA